MEISPVAKKLGIKPDMRVVLLNAPDGVTDLLAPLPSGATIGEGDAGAPADCVLVFVPDLASVATWLPRALAAGDPGRLLWFAYPKGGAKAGTDLNRDILWGRLDQAGLAGVSLVAVDGTWSAMRARHPDQVKSSR